MKEVSQHTASPDTNGYTPHLGGLGGPWNAGPGISKAALQLPHPLLQLCRSLLCGCHPGVPARGCQLLTQPLGFRQLRAVLLPSDLEVRQVSGLREGSRNCRA